MQISSLLCRFRVCLIGVTVVWALMPGQAAAEPIPREYFSIDVETLVAEFTPEQIVSKQAIVKDAWRRLDTSPHVVVPTTCEAYWLVPGNTDIDIDVVANINQNYRGSRIVGSKPKGKAFKGNLFLLRPAAGDDRKLVLVRFQFEVESKAKTPASRKDFLLAKGRHFQRLWSEGVAGAAMFRHLANQSLQEIGQSASLSKSSRRHWSNAGIDDSIRLMSGGRAVSENLQLDQGLAVEGQGAPLKSLDKVRGITIREIDWTRFLQDQPTELDPLAHSVPHDQYAVFLPSFEALAKLVDQGNKLSQPVVQFLEPQSRRTDVLGFYQQQLGLPLNALTRQVGGTLINEVTITGSDPYFRTGTDLAIVMGTSQPQFLQQALQTQISTLAGKIPTVTKTEHQVNGQL
ncbi:MAG: hypothetical protein MI861_20820, partial [Pirellulales bacterium]|nr:hypothetical protein [Pirellulales bacterium]